METTKEINPVFVQPNAEMRAMYEYSPTQKDLIRNLIDKMKTQMTNDSDFSQGMFDNLIIEMGLQDIVKPDYYSALLDLAKK